MAIWGTILLGNNGISNNTPQLIVAYMITECIVNYLQAVNSVRNIMGYFIKADHRPGVNAISCLSIGTVIWNIVLLFHDVGIDKISDNPYYIYIFVQFLVNMIVIGLTVVIGSIVLCCTGCTVFSELSHEPQHKPPQDPSTPDMFSLV